MLSRSKRIGFFTIVGIVFLTTVCSGTPADTTASSGPGESGNTDPTTTTTAFVPLCSAQRLDPETKARDNISTEAEAKRITIIDAAMDCDYDALAALAVFDGGAELVTRWRAGEQADEDPLKRLVLLMRGSIATIARGGVEYRFPSAAGFDTWAEVPENVRRILLDVYTEKDVAAFDAADAYTGDITALSEGGDWMYFTTGDR